MGNPIDTAFAILKTDFSDLDRLDWRWAGAHEPWRWGGGGGKAGDTDLWERMAMNNVMGQLSDKAVESSVGDEVPCPCCNGTGTSSVQSNQLDRVLDDFGRPREPDTGHRPHYYGNSPFNQQLNQDFSDYVKRHKEGD